MEKQHVIVIEVEGQENEEIVLSAEDTGFYEVFREMRRTGDEGETYTLFSVEENGGRVKIESYRYDD